MNRVSFLFVAIALCSTAGSAALTDATLRLARARGWFDLPNDRSSHTAPTPRGGGISIVVMTLGAELILWSRGHLDTPQLMALLIGGMLVACVGALDDIRSVAIRWRLTAQFVAGTIAVAALATSSALSFDGIRLSLTGVGGAASVVGIVWMTNLYNFMDGIDGIAGSQGVVASAVAAVLFALTDQAGLSVTATALCGAIIGFLIFNWAPARVFMGDVGSCFLGFTFAVLAIAGDHQGGVSAVWILLPLSPFIADTAVALVSRVARGARVGSAHREHLYQRLVQNGYTHSTVALRFGIWAAAMGCLSIFGHTRPAGQGWPILLLTAASTVGIYRGAARKARRIPLDTIPPLK